MIQAQNDMRSSQTGLEAERNSCESSDSERRLFGLSGNSAASINTTIFSPIAGRIVKRKVGHGQ